MIYYSYEIILQSLYGCLSSDFDMNLIFLNDFIGILANLYDWF